MTNFIKSDLIWVYPCARRYQNDIGAKLSTEENLTHLASMAGRDSYVIKTATEDSVEYIYFMLGRYYVKANFNSIKEAVNSSKNKPVYASCMLTDVNLDNTHTTKVLKNLRTTSSTMLDELESSSSTDYYFVGITFTESASTSADYSLQVWTGTKIPDASFGSIDADKIMDNSIGTSKISSDARINVTGTEGFLDANMQLRKLINSDLPSIGNISNDGKLSSASVAVVTDANKNITGESLSVSDPTASGNATEAITSISQNSIGKITVTKAVIPDGKLNVKGNNDTAYQQVFSANKVADTSVNIKASIGQTIYDGTTPTVEVNLDENNNLNFAFDKLIGNLHPYSDAASCTRIGDFYVSGAEGNQFVNILTQLEPEKKFTCLNGSKGEDGRGISSITGPTTIRDTDTYTINYTDETTSTFNVVNGVDSFGYCTWNGSTATANYPAFKWSTNKSEDIGRKIWLYFAEDKSGNSLKLTIDNYSSSITNNSVTAGWYYAECVSGISWTLTPIIASNNNLKITNGILNADNATSTTNGFMSATDKAKLDNVETGAQANVQSDWNATSGDALILNKPTIPTVNGQDRNTIPYFVNAVATRGLKIWVQEESAADPTTGMVTGDILIKY